jgi:signal transduction histidine kinase
VTPRVLDRLPRLTGVWPAVLATLLGAAVALSRLALEPVLGGSSPSILAAPAIMLAAYLGGFWPAMIVGAVSVWVSDEAMALAGLPLMKPGGIVIFAAFILVFAGAGAARQRGLARARRDAAEIKALQERLAKVARLNAMGEMAGALAHELNQPLTAISSFAGAAKRVVARQPQDCAQALDYLDKVAEQTVRAREIISRVRAQVGQAELVLKPQSLAAMFDETITVARASAGLSASVRKEFDARADRVMADRVQVEQVMLNLIRNAAEAMAGRPRQEIRVGSRPAGEGFIEAYVADTGPGLDPELAERLFQPFVTGKAEGMGIGLAVSRGIIEAHGGAISAETAPSGGAVFRFTLPLAEDEPAKAPKPRRAA